MENRKRILFVLPFLPYPMDTGGAQAIFNGIDVVKDDFEVFVTYRSFGEKDSERERRMNELLSDKVTILSCVFPKKANVKLSSKQKVATLLYKTEKRLRNAAGIEIPVKVRIPHKAWVSEELFPKENFFMKHVLKLVEEHQIDIVQCEMLRNVTIGLELPRQVRKVFVHHELGWVVHELELQGLQGDALEQKTYLDYYRICEVGLLNIYDDVITLSSVDADKLKEAGVTVPIHTSLAVVNTSASKLVSANQWNVLSFVGPECNTPNVEGLKWFLGNVWENLRRHDNSYRLQIIGNWSGKTISELLNGREGVSYMGFVDDLSAAIKDTIIIVPITIGSGIRMKILEAASMGVPFVTTTVGVEGIPVESGVHCFVADSPEDFMKAIIKLKDSELRQRFAGNANRLVKECYSLEALKRNRLDIYNR